MTFTHTFKKITSLIAGLGLLAGLAACGSDPTAGTGTSGTTGSSSHSSSSEKSSGSTSPIVVGSANFAESQILGDIYEQALNRNGVKASSKPNIGSREVYVRALQDGSISLIPDYTGNLLQYFNPKATQSASNEVYAALRRQTPKNLAVLDQSPAQDADNIVITRKLARQKGVTSLADLKKIGNLSIAAPPEFGKRAYGIPGLKKVYGVDVRLVPVSDEGGQATVNAVEQGTTTLAKLTTTSPFLTDGKLITLKDPKHLIAAQNVVPLASASLVKNAKAVTVINAVQARLTTSDLIDMNRKSTVGKQPADQIAAAWLKTHPIRE